MTSTPLRPSLTPSPTAAGEVQIRLAPLLPPNAYTPEQLQISVDVMRQRLTHYNINNAVIDIKPNDEIVIEFQDNSRLVFLPDVLTTEGNIEIIDLSAQTLDDRQALLGRTLITDRYLARIQMRYTLQNGDTPTLEATPIGPVPHTFNQATGEPYVTLFDNTLMTGAWVDYLFGGSPNHSVDTWAITTTLSEVAQQIMVDYADEHPGQLFGILLDSTLIDAQGAILPLTQLTLRYAQDERMDENQARRLAAIADSGPMPVPMQVIDVQTAG